MPVDEEAPTSERPRRKRRRREGDCVELSNASLSSMLGSSRTAIIGVDSPDSVCQGQSSAVDPQITRLRLRARSKSRLKSRWYTSMLGKLSSVAEVVAAIREYKVSDLLSAFRDYDGCILCFATL